MSAAFVGGALLDRTVLADQREPAGAGQRVAAGAELGTVGAGTVGGGMAGGGTVGAALSTEATGGVDAAASWSPVVPVAKEPARVGPWGRLSVERLNLEPPLELTVPSDCVQDLPDWYLRGQNAESVGAFFANMGLDETARTWLLAHTDCYLEGCVSRPTFDLVKQLQPDVRRRLYGELRKEPQNRTLMHGFRCPKGEFEARVSNAGLDPATEARLRSVSYVEDGLVRMYDAAFLCSRSPSDADRVRIVRTLARAPAIVGHVDLDEKDDLAQVASYWNAHGRRRDVLPLLQSVRQSPRGSGHAGSVDVMHLLPSMPRARLDTYVRANEPRYECTWTTRNFFSEHPDEIMFPDMVGALEFLAKDYGELTPAAGALMVDDSTDLALAGQGLELGDVLAFINEDGLPIHMASQVASDLVFTKNGVGDWNPWVMMRLREVMIIYPRAVRVRVFRLNVAGAPDAMVPVSAAH